MTKPSSFLDLRSVLHAERCGGGKQILGNEYLRVCVSLFAFERNRKEKRKPYFGGHVFWGQIDTKKRAETPILFQSQQQTKFS